jgi:TrmH family RNA methyltransferase
MPMEIVTSRQNPAIQMVRSLLAKKGRSETGLFATEGERVLARAKAKGWEPDFLLATGPTEPWGAARRLLVAEKLMRDVTGRDNPPAVLGVFKQRWSTPSTNGTWLMLDGLRDPGNLGTIIRTADAVAASGIVLAGNCCDPWGAECVRATAGSIFAVPLVRLALDDAVGFATTWPGDVVAADISADGDYRRNYREPTLLIVGGETKGLSPTLRETARIRVSIPMPGGTESLNAAIATALLLYEVRRSALQPRDQA